MAGQALGLAAGGRAAAELAQAFGDRRECGVGLVELGQGHVDALLGLGALLLEPGEGEAEAFSGGDGLGQLRPASSTAAWTSSRLGGDDEPPAAKWARAGRRRA